mmetsp:Transcript_18109/g.45528  ORF Transcript_18109/g.45528 Transcript_18109/m.45528 type:complete len:137 (+) Transcript_18109:1178-1588(+)
MATLPKCAVARMRRPRRLSSRTPLVMQVGKAALYLAKSGSPRGHRSPHSHGDRPHSRPNTAFFWQGVLPRMRRQMLPRHFAGASSTEDSCKVRCGTKLLCWTKAIYTRALLLIVLRVITPEVVVAFSVRKVVTDLG